MDLASKWASIGLDRDYSSVRTEGLEMDLQGWGSQHPVFASVINEFRPKLVVEVGTWKGASLLHMAKVAEQAGTGTQFICVDTWLGSNDTLWLDPELRKSLLIEGGYPTMYRQFIHNIVSTGIADRVFPLPMTSSAAYYVLKQLDIRPDAVYIDAGHEEDEVAIDLKFYWDLLEPGGTLFGDDYMREWPGVVAAVNKFAAAEGRPLWTSPGKFLIKKPE